MRDGQAARLLRVIDKVPLGEPRGGIADDFDIIFGGRHAAVAAEAVEQRFELGLCRQGIFAQRQRQVGHVIIDPDGKARLRLGGLQFTEYRQHAFRTKLLGGETVAAADSAR